MPDNKSNNNRKPNSTLSYSLEERGRDFLEGTAQEREARARREREAQRAEGLEMAIEAGAPNGDVLAKIAAKSISMVDALNPRIGLYGETRLERSVNGVRSDIRRSFERTRGGVQALSMSSAATATGVNGLNIPYSDLESQYGAQQTRMSRLEQLSSRAAGRLYSVDAEGNSVVNGVAQKRIATFSQEAELLQGQMAGTIASMRQQKGMGKDPNSVAQNRIQALGMAEGILGTNAARDAVTSGTGLGAKSAQELDSLAASAAKNLAKAFDDLTKGVTGAGEAVDSYAKELKEIQAVTAAGGGGGGGRASDRYGFAAGMFGAAGNIIQQVDVNQRLGAMYNIAGTAGLENQKYDMYKKARSGDVASQMLLSQWSGAEKFGSQIKFSANEALVLHGAAGAAAAAAGSAQAAEATGQKFNPFAYISGNSTQNTSAALEGTNRAVQGGAQSAIAAGDILQGVSSGQAKNAAVAAQMEAARQVLAIPAEQLQGFRDFRTGMGTVARGMGSGGAAFLNGANNLTLQRMAENGISPEQMVQMSQMGQSNMGSMFAKEQVFGARNLEKSGFGTMQENMQRMSTLASAGSNNPQAGLSAVLEAAFGKSLENAKTLNMLVENTAAMASGSVGGRAGLDVTAETATMITANMDPGQGNREFALQRARTAAELANNIVTDKSVSFVNMSKMARIGRITGLGGEDQTYASGLDIATLNKTANMAPEEAAKFLRGQGVAANKGNAASLVAGLQRAAGMSILAQGTIGQTGVDTEDLYKKIRNKETLNAQEQIQVGRAAKQGGFASGEDLVRSIQGVGAVNDPNAKTTVTDVGAGKAGSKELKEADKLLTSGFSQLSEAAQAAATRLGGATKAMEKLIQLQDLANKEGGAKGEKEFGEAGGKAAGANMFTEGAKTFNTAAGKWDEIADKLIKAGIGDSKNTTLYPKSGNSRSGASPGGD